MKPLSVRSAAFVKSSSEASQCPAPDRPEYAFIGRSNVGKSSLINYVCGRKELAKTSGKPGKTRLINHYLIDESWYLVDLPGYGYAGVSKVERARFNETLRSYLAGRENLVALFVLIDLRHPAQKIDLEFLEWLGEQEIPFALVFTKLDKLSGAEANNHKQAYLKVLSETWEPLPDYFVTSSTAKVGREELLGWIGGWNKALKDRFKPLPSP
ncbi:YihA family ribosome biogenesis GTP-binding protein [bacterium]|nr:YihA family ribosome biogenesis GTP-binding protein [bacterium]